MLRQVLWGVVALLLIPFVVNQLSSRLDFSWTIWVGLAAIVIAVVLVATSEPVLEALTTNLGRPRILVIVAVGLLTGAAGAIAAWFALGTANRVVWNFDNFLGMGEQRIGDKMELLISDFQATGTNRS